MTAVTNDSEQADLLDAVLARLISQIPTLSSKNCLLSIVPDPPYKISDNQFVTVSPTGGTFPDDLLSGGGASQCTEDTGVIVTIFSRLQLGTAADDREVLCDQVRGILRMKRLVLKALTAQDLSVNANYVLRSLLLPKLSSPPDFANNNDKGLAKISVQFSVSFDWNLG